MPRLVACIYWMSLGAVLLVIGEARAEEPPRAPAAPSSEQDAPAPSSEEDAKVVIARAAFEEGLDLARQGRWTEGLAAFERSNRLRPHPVTTYNIGFCALSLARYVVAKKMLVSALAAKDEGGGSVLPEDLRTAAEGYLTEAEQSLVKVSVTLTPRTARVSVDGRPLELTKNADGTTIALAGMRDAGAPEPIPGGVITVDMDPGAHRFEAVDGNGLPSEVRRSFAPGAHTELRLTAFPPHSTDARKPSPPPEHTTASPTATPSLVPAYIAFGIGAAGIVTGSIAGVVALEKRNDLDQECPAKGCPEGTPTTSLDAANRAATVATISFGIGVVASVAGAYLWWTARPFPQAEKARGVQILPAIGWKSGGISGRF